MRTWRLNTDQDFRDANKTFPAGIGAGIHEHHNEFLSGSKAFEAQSAAKGSSISAQAQQKLHLVSYQIPAADSSEHWCTKVLSWSQNLQNEFN